MATREKVCQHCHGPVERVGHVPGVKYECPVHGEVHAIPKPPETVSCFGCGGRVRKGNATEIDISREDEYYPKIRYLGQCCQSDGGESA